MSEKFTVTYFDPDSQTTRRVVQDWDYKEFASAYARELRMIFERVRVVPVSKTKNIPMSTD